MIAKGSISGTKQAAVKRTAPSLVPQRAFGPAHLALKDGGLMA